jgi:hypothetical protein
MTLQPPNIVLNTDNAPRIIVLVIAQGLFTVNFGDGTAPVTSTSKEQQFTHRYPKATTIYNLTVTPVITSGPSTFPSKTVNVFPQPVVTIKPAS